MSRALIIGMEENASEQLRAGSEGDGLVVEPVRSTEELLSHFGEDPSGVDAVIIGPLEEEPLETVQQVARADGELGVIVFARPDRVDALRATFQVTPFLGRGARLYGLDEVPSLSEELRRVVEDTRQRRSHRQTLQIVSSQLSVPQPAHRRPSAMLDSLLELAPVGVLEMDTRGQVLACNPAAERIVGLPAEHITKAPLSRLLPSGLETLVEEARETGSVSKATLERDGARGPQSLELLVAPVGEVPHGTQGFLLVLQDTTAETRMQREREGLIQQLDTAVRLRDEFLSVASHELKTPLTSMLGWVQMLRSGRVTPEKVSRGLEVIERNARAQAQLIEDLLDVSRIVAGKLRLEVGSLNLEDTLRAAVDSVGPAAEAKELSLELTVEDGSGAVMGDPPRLQQVFWNLLTNAVKFTPPGGRIDVSLYRSRSTAVVTVRDTGEGIAPEFLPYVFERFRQADSTATRRHGGLGLGLSIVRHLVELHGGRVTVTSEGYGRGATFRVALPLAPASIGSRTPEASAEEVLFDCPEGVAGMNVLLVEEEPDLRELLTTTLERCQVRVTAVDASEETVVAAVIAHLPEVLIVDVGAPGGEGHALLRTVRGLPAERGGRTPALAVTALASPDERKKALRSGFQHYVAKPVPPEELLLLVATLAGRL